MELPTVALLRLAYNELSRQVTDAVSEVEPESRPSHGNVMEQLQIRDGQRLTDLAQGAGMALQSIGEIVDQLEDLGMVERRPDPDDRRAKRIHMTAKAQKSGRAALEAVMSTETRLEELLGVERSTALKSDLARVVEAYGGKVPGLT